jgi:hypothetical protein
VVSGVVYPYEQTPFEKAIKSGLLCQWMRACLSSSFFPLLILGLLPLKGQVSDVFIAATSGISGAGKEVSEDDNLLFIRKAGCISIFLKLRKRWGLKGLFLYLRE